MARIAIAGGSYNPPHVAHQMAWLWLLSTGRADAVWVTPCARHPLGKALAPFDDRVAMCRRAAAPFAPGTVEVSTVEARPGGDGRTLHTLRHLVAAHPEHAFSLAIGADILAERAAWYRFDAIERLVPLHVIGRQGYESGEAVSPPLPPVASRDIRRRLSAGEPVAHLLPAGVLGYIRERGLYGATA